MRSFSKGKAFPKFQKALVDLKIHSKHQILLYYEYEGYFLKIQLFYFIFLHRLHNIFKIQQKEAKSFKTDQKH